MSDEAWENARDELITKAENWLDGLGYSALTVKENLNLCRSGVDGDDCGQDVIGKCLADALCTKQAIVNQGYAHLLVDPYGILATVPLPLPVKEFIRAWNEGVLQ